jgi:hypothetical protein
MSYKQIYRYECNLCEIQEDGNEDVRLPRDWMHVEWSIGPTDSRVAAGSDPLDFCPKCAFIVKDAWSKKGG